MSQSPGKAKFTFLTQIEERIKKSKDKAGQPKNNKRKIDRKKMNADQKEEKKKAKENSS